MGVLADFKAFVTKDSFATMAVGIVVGMAVTMVVSGLVSDLVNPLIGLALHGNLDSELVVSVWGSTFLFGAFLSALINFVVVLAVIFFVIVYPLAQHQARVDARKPKGPPTTRECPECCSAINVKAKRCPFCGSAVSPAA